MLTLENLPEGNQQFWFSIGAITVIDKQQPDVRAREVVKDIETVAEAEEWFMRAGLALPAGWQPVVASSDSVGYELLAVRTKVLRT